jgi:hypothetical protein
MGGRGVSVKNPAKSDNLKLDRTKKWEVESPPGLTAGVIFVIFALPFTFGTPALWILYPIDLTALGAGGMMLAGGVAFGAFGIRSLVLNVKRIRLNERIVNEGECVYGYIIKSAVDVHRKSGGGKNYLTEYAYTTVDGEHKRAALKASYDSNTHAPMFVPGKQIVVAYLGGDSVILRKYHFVEDGTPKTGKPKTNRRSFKGLSGETVKIDTSKWWHTSTFSKFYFWIFLVSGVLGLLTTGVGVALLLTFKDNLMFIALGVLGLPAYMALIFGCLSLKGRVKEKRIYRTGKFTHANVYPMRSVYEGDEKEYITYCYKDDKGQKHEKQLTARNRTMAVAGSNSRDEIYLAAYTDDGESILMLADTDNEGAVE